ncbi:MAG: sulfatase-like hydrolase/transferase [Thermoanaerobaculia bacterium]|nr:sulfatase-like hydrolase/transferase [Thermoanaerobaculia bacterium]
MLVSDTLRSDVLECYGGPAKAPNICGLADRGTLFETSYSAAPWTLPSAVGMFTGFSPARYRRDQTSQDEAITHFYLVGSEEVLLAERLVEEGYTTAQRLENRVAGQGRSLQGLEDVRFGSKRAVAARERWGPQLGYEPRDGRYDLVWWLVDRLLGETDEQPFFYLHWFNDPHAAYRPPAAFMEGLGQEVDELPEELSFYTHLGHKGRPEKGRFRMRDVAPNFSPAELALVQDLYRLEVESVDERVGLILRALEASGKADRTVVVFTSDHGEGFGEHGDFLHGVSLHEELVRVPLILAGPGVPVGRRIAAPVSHLDLMPTLAALTGTRMEEEGEWPGTDLLAWIEEPHPSERALHLSSPDRLSQEAIVFGTLKLIAGEEGRDPRLYDLALDPAERENVALERVEETDRLLRELYRTQLASEALRAKSATLSDDLEAAERETTEQLRTVGYID